MVSGVLITLVKLNKICLNKTCNKVHMVKYFSLRFLIKVAYNKEMFYRHCFSTLLQNMSLEKSRKTRKD
jgi:hypothetical protein